MIERPAPWALALAAGAVVLGVGVGAILAYRAWRRREARRDRTRKVAAASLEHLRDVVLPDGADGWFHLDFLMLTPQSIVVLEVRDVVGRLYGGEQMPEWTVIGKDRRQTFENPTHRLYDRMAAVRGWVGEDVPVDGRIVFGGQPEFPKGRPPQVAALDELHLEFDVAPEFTETALVERLRAAWELLKTKATPSVTYR